ncbi:hydrogenase nickel incorporation protein HypB [Cohaesibacter marisflavi]|uniref:Hydrogenase maturation factor HypB n=1 Tax=Cohaesibacter marisflavi TaxID=655353 RepID=A0A1I5LVG2_9HYPH|nr:hydrogenase nickel incorporation protein HypB [Cohaesibacter marisflavi]SFP01328.1 hydrogenase nickel incorporation protein HypB [Cohaesibacter marisflavi]
MCGTCGCSDPNSAVSMIDPETGEASLLRSDHDHHHHDHTHHHHHHVHNAHGLSHHHDHDHSHEHSGRIISVEQAILMENDRLAQRNRGWFEGRGVLALNLVSSPGAGKTTLLEKTIEALSPTVELTVIEGDQMTTNDADRIRAAGASALQINTGAGCHLEADMIAAATKKLNPAPGSIVMIENVGNLVCPAMFDLGEHMKIAIVSTTEGDDKPVKYPYMFSASEVVIVNKIDLAPYVDFDEERISANIRQVNPQARIFMLSARTGEGMAEWIDFLKELKRDMSVAG